MTNLGSYMLLGIRGMLNHPQQILCQLLECAKAQFQNLGKTGIQNLVKIHSNLFFESLYTSISVSIKLWK